MIFSHNHLCQFLFSYGEPGEIYNSRLEINVQIKHWNSSNARRYRTVGLVSHIWFEWIAEQSVMQASSNLWQKEVGWPPFLDIHSRIIWYHKLICIAIAKIFWNLKYLGLGTGEDLLYLVPWPIGKDVTRVFMFIDPNGLCITNLLFFLFGNWPLGSLGSLRSLNKFFE